MKTFSYYQVVYNDIDASWFKEYTGGLQTGHMHLWHINSTLTVCAQIKYHQ